MASSSDDSERDLFDALERRARESVSEPDASADGDSSDAPDLLDALRSGTDPATDMAAGGDADEPSDSTAESEADESEGDPPDLTMIGYIARHDRPPAFEGTDEQPYTVDVDVEETGDAARPYAAFFVFVRWAQTGAGIMGHVESEDVAYGESEADAKQAALEVSLYEVKAELDAAIARRERLMED